jgi:hypothetical protein
MRVKETRRNRLRYDSPMTPLLINERFRCPASRQPRLGYCTPRIDLPDAVVLYRLFRPFIPFFYNLWLGVRHPPPGDDPQFASPMIVTVHGCNSAVCLSRC